MPPASMRILPGDPCRILLGERATDAACNVFNHARGLDRPIPDQFLDYLGGLSRGDLGSSFRTSRPVTALLIERLPMTLELTLGVSNPISHSFSIGSGQCGQWCMTSTTSWR